MLRKSIKKWHLGKMIKIQLQFKIIKSNPNHSNHFQVNNLKNK